MFRGAVVVLAAAVALIAPATASAAAPGVAVRAESNVTFNSVFVNARIDPNNIRTTYFVRFGLTKLYGLETAHQEAGSGGAPRDVSIPLTGLAPDTRYHYRVIAVNENGAITRSKDQTFRTRKQPLGVTLVATPAAVAPNAPTVLTGQLTGTNNANRDVRIEASQWPYTTGFAQIGNKIVTDSQGNFTFNVLNVPFNTQFRVALAQRPEVVSPVVVVAVPDDGEDRHPHGEDVPPQQEGALQGHASPRRPSRLRSSCRRSATASGRPSRPPASGRRAPPA